MCIVTWCLTAFLAAAVTGDSSRQYVQVSSFTNCPDRPNLPNGVNETSMRTDYITDEYYITGTLQLTEPIEAGVTSLHVTISKCLSEDDSNSCGKFFETTEEDFCAHIADQDKVWSPVIAKIQDFDPVCPVPAGDYSLSDALIAMTPLEDMDAPNGFYQIEMLFLDVDEPQMCVVAKGKLRARKRKRKKPEANPVEGENAFRRAASGKRASLKRKGHF